MAMARGRKGGQRSGRTTVSPTALLRVKRAKPGCERGCRCVKKGKGKRREGGRCRWDERKSGIRGAPLRLPRLGHAAGRSRGCQRVLGGIQNLLGIGIKKSLSINLSALFDLPTPSSSGNHSASVIPAGRFARQTHRFSRLYFYLSKIPKLHQ